jgi:hypothetical protein
MKTFSFGIQKNYWRCIDSCPATFLEFIDNLATEIEKGYGIQISNTLIKCVMRCFIKNSYFESKGVETCNYIIMASSG